MGNCAPKPKHVSKLQPQSALHLHGSASCPLLTRIRIFLLLKSIPFSFTPNQNLINKPFLKFGSETIRSGAILKFLESKFGGGAPSGTENAAEAVITLQHRSLNRHLAGLDRWVRDELTTHVENGGKDRVRVGEWYGWLVDVMLEHAQMEETFLFPAFEKVCGSDVCKKAIENHGRDLPMMNGIKEVIKMLSSVEVETPFYREALSNLSVRLYKFQDHCKEHFEEEEKKLLPLLQEAEMARRHEGNGPWSTLVWANNVMNLMEKTHSDQLFPFLIAGLSPNEAARYIDIMCRCANDDLKLLPVLHSVIIWCEGMTQLSWMRHVAYLKH